MADWDQFEFEMEADMPAEPTACQVCEAMLPDAVDGVLSEAEQRAFDRHVAGCVVCSRGLEEAQRGAAWLHMLKQQSPEPVPALLERILAQTTGAHAADAAVIADVEAASVQRLPVWASSALPEQPVRGTGPARARVTAGWRAISGAFSVEWMRPMLQPRMAMTAAMAFFSIALTLNLTGVRLKELSASSLRPASVRRAVADKSAAAVRSFENMRVVYQAEAQVNDLRTNWQAAAQENERTQEPQPQEGPKPGAPQQHEPQKEQGKPQGSSELNFVPVNPQGAAMTRKGA